MVRSSSPRCVIAGRGRCILLTGYADITSTIDAINKGQIYRYVSKPWDDNDILLTVRQALNAKDA